MAQTSAGLHAATIATLTLALARAMDEPQDVSIAAHRALVNAVEVMPIGPGQWYIQEVIVETMRKATLARFREIGSLLVACEEARDLIRARITR